jgi:hypothetical protein
MIIILGLIILVAALVAGAAGVLSNGGSAHAVSHFSVLGYHLTGSAGTLFLSGFVVGAAGLLGLSLLLAGARRTSRRGSAARRGLRQSRSEAAAAGRERDDLMDQRDTARAYSASQLGNGTGPAAPHRPAGDRWSRLRDLKRRLGPPQTGGQSDLPGHEGPAGSSGPEAAATSTTSDVTDGASDPDVAAIYPVLDGHATASGPAE